jgi:hypothetical protein
MTHYPATHLLVPANPPAPPDDFTVVRLSLTNGLPHIVDLTAGLALKVTLPTGLMNDWLRADPSTLVAASDDESQPRPDTPAQEIGGVSRAALRLAIVRGGSTLSIMPAALATRRSLPDAGEAAQGVVVDIVLLGWRISAGTLQGPGDFGSYIHFGWKTADEGASEFGPPAINPYLQRRLAPQQAVRSELGLVKPVVGRRFSRRRLARHVHT